VDHQFFFIFWRIVHPHFLSSSQALAWLLHPIEYVHCVGKWAVQLILHVELGCGTMNEVDLCTPLNWPGIEHGQGRNDT
jgi:hypothetical protein